MKMTRTPSNHIVQVLDLSGLCERATISKNKSDITRLKKGEKLEHAFTWGVVEVAGLAKNGAPGLEEELKLLTAHMRDEK